MPTMFYTHTRQKPRVPWYRKLWSRVRYPQFKLHPWV